MSKDKDITSLRKELDNYQNLNASLYEQLERAHKENLTLTDENATLRKKIQQEINNNHNECERLESELYQQGQEIERLKKENVGFLKNKREVERKLREETQAFEKDRIIWQERDRELIDQIKVLQETKSFLAQQNEQEKKNEDNSSYVLTRELKTAQRSNKDFERRNNELSAELEKAKQATTESVNMNKTHAHKIHQLENELSQVKHMNQTLMEENESFQRMVFEHTMKGEFTLNSRNESHKSNKKVTSGITEEETLRNELDRAKLLSTFLLGERVHKESGDSFNDKLQEEIRLLKDENKDMKLYINKILNRILERQGFEDILDLDLENKKPADSTPSTPTTGSFNFNNNNDNNDNSSSTESKTKKVERRKTFSGWHFRSTSQPQNNFSEDKDKISEEPDHIEVPIPISRRSNEDTPSVQKRALRRNSTSITKNSKRFSLFSWGGGVKDEGRKEDPYMRPMILLQEKERKE